MYRLSVFVSLCVSLVAAGQIPVNSQAPTITVKEGEPAEFQCSYPKDLPGLRVEWKFVNMDQETSIVYYEGELTVPYKNRAVSFPQGFRITSVTRKDSGEYVCEVTSIDSSGTTNYGEAKIQLTVLVPPSTPVAQVPSSVTTGGVAELVCIEKDSSPPATFAWYKNKILLPDNPKSSPTFQNSTYTIDPKTGVLKFDPVLKTDVGEYYCEASNSQGKQTSAAISMSVSDVNVGGIVAAVVVVLIILALIAFGVWFAYSRGYFTSTKKVIYSQPSETRSDRNFQQTSSFLV
ncbi:junctional adhesion molecule A [Rhinophrynus dorsalis]